MPLKDPQKRKEYNKKYVQEHREKINKYSSKWGKKNREKRREIEERYRKKNRVKINIRSSELRLQARLEVINHYGGKCTCCGEDELEFLCIDHINGGGKKHREEINSTNIYTWLINNNYPEGFRVLCHNCNMSLGIYGYCPHEIRRKNENNN